MDVDNYMVSIKYTTKREDKPLSSVTTSQRNKVREKASGLVQNYTTISCQKRSAAENGNHWKTAIMNFQCCTYPTLDKCSALQTCLSKTMNQQKYLATIFTVINSVKHVFLRNTVPLFHLQISYSNFYAMFSFQFVKSIKTTINYFELLMNIT